VFSANLGLNLHIAVFQIHPTWESVSEARWQQSVIRIKGYLSARSDPIFEQDVVLEVADMDRTALYDGATFDEF
jgi:hypothetical protein